MSPQKLGYVSLFSSAGVGCYGFTLEQFDCIVTSELIKRRLDIQRYNNVCSSDSGYVPGDIKDPKVIRNIFDEISQWMKKNHRKEVDVVIATPPCQGISVANHKKKNELSRNSLVVESIKIVKKIEPRFFVMENVRGFLNTICTDIDGRDKSIKEAVYVNLAGNYNIATKVINFKNYGSNSSRTRTVVIGIRKDIEEITPFDLFPNKKSPPTLRELIGEFPRLKKMGEISKEDIFHSFRPYQPHMLEWIKDLKEGESAFDNIDINKRPGKLLNNIYVENQNKNGDKYRKCLWDKVAPCVHTRNDILASQSTIHPEDNRVFSIRELMRFMSIPDEFKWTEDDFETLNNLSDEEKTAYLKKNEPNIRQCLGEAVPTAIFQAIAQKIKAHDSLVKLKIQEVNSIITKKKLFTTDNIIDYIEKSELTFSNATKIAELANAKRLDDAAFYTRQDLCFNLIYDLPDFKNKKIIRILEPSVGVGNFLPTIIEKYKHVEQVHIDLVDINKESMDILSVLMKKIYIPQNFTVNLINDDFLTHSFNTKYDLVVGNPPFKKLDSEEIKKYSGLDFIITKKTNNIFAFFIQKALSISSVVAFFTPKSLLNAPEFNELREILGNFYISKISDYGEKGFKGVKIETLSIQIQKNVIPDFTIVESYPLRSYTVNKQKYLMDNLFPYWIIYRNKFFDEMCDRLSLGIFNVIRDRSLTTKNTQKSGQYRVIKSRNISENGVIELATDTYINHLDQSPIAKNYLNKPNIIIAPNLSYYPRAAFLPNNAVVDGSAAILSPKSAHKISSEDLKYFSSEEFFIFYRIARNFATRSLNIDSNSVFFWGLPNNNKLMYKKFTSDRRSDYLFSTKLDSPYAT